MQEMVYSAKITLYNSYFDFNDNLSPKAILNIFQDMASIHAEEIGIGFNNMLNKNLYWVLSRVKFDIIKMPKVNQTIIAKTWPHPKGRIDFDRDFQILSESGELLIKGTSKWCVINTQTRALQRTDDVNYNGECILDKNYEEKFGKIIVPEENFEFKFNHTVRFSDLDHNKHMNNTNYALLAISALENKYFNHFEINFLNECLMGDEIVLSTLKNNNGEYVLGENKNTQSFTVFVK